MSQTTSGNPASPDPFAILGIPCAFEIDPAVVARAFLAKSALQHPDISGADPDTAQQLQAALNDARALLLDAESRANLLLALLGGPGKEIDKSLPQGFLLHMMETREQIESALDTGDDSQRRHWSRWADEQRAHYIAAVTPLFARALAGERFPLTDIRRQLNAWRYIERLVEQLDPAYDPSKADFQG